MTELEQMLYEAVSTEARQDKINEWFDKWSDREVIQSQMASTIELLAEARRQTELRKSTRHEGYWPQIAFH